MVKTAELEQGLNNLFGGLLASQSKAAQANPVYKYLIEHPEIFKTPSDFNFHVLNKIEDAIEEAVKTVKSGNYEYINIFTDFQFYENHGEFKHEVRQFQKPYDNQQAEQISLMV
ncbi:hypothetical protein WAI54_11800, partial [Acinetobacter baumannii]